MVSMTMDSIPSLQALVRAFCEEAAGDLLSELRRQERGSVTLGWHLFRQKSPFQGPHPGAEEALPF